MKKFMRNLDVKMIAIIIVIVLMTGVGIRFMEDEWIEPMSGIIWLVGEAMIVAVMTFKNVMKFIMNEAKDLYQKMLED